MTGFALLDEVYGKGFTKKNKKSKDNVKNSKLRTVPYQDLETVYEEIPVNRKLNNYEEQFNKQKQQHKALFLSPPNCQTNISSIHDILEDPEYRDYLEYRLLKDKKECVEPLKEGFENKIIVDTPEDQFNELLLYIFTGFFFIMIINTMYKLGRDSY